MIFGWGAAAAPLQVAAAQICVRADDLSHNIDAHLRCMSTAASFGVQALLFPELSLTGYELKRPDASDAVREALGHLHAQAIALNLLTIVGAPKLVDGQPRIAGFAMHPDASVTVHAKTRLGSFGDDACVDLVAGATLPPPEAKRFSSGRAAPPFHVGPRSAALRICAELSMPGQARGASEQGAELLFASMFVIPSAHERETAPLPRYATTHNMCVVFSNYGGPTGGLQSSGRSAVWSPAGERLCQLPERSEGLAIARFDAGDWRGQCVVL